MMKRLRAVRARGTLPQKLRPGVGESAVGGLLRFPSRERLFVNAELAASHVETTGVAHYDVRLAHRNRESLRYVFGC
jgi:hypothetical protein